jgi:hypothetical protein
MRCPFCSPKHGATFSPTATLRRKIMKRIALLALVTFAVFGGSAAQVRAADCSINTNACISGNQGKPNAVAKCQAAGQRCAKTGTFVGAAGADQPAIARERPAIAG